MDSVETDNYDAHAAVATGARKASGAIGALILIPVTTLNLGLPPRSSCQSQIAGPEGSATTGARQLSEFISLDWYGSTWRGYPLLPKGHDFLFISHAGAVHSAGQCKAEGGSGRTPSKLLQHAGEKVDKVRLSIPVCPLCDSVTLHEPLPIFQQPAREIGHVRQRSLEGGKFDSHSQFAAALPIRRGRTMFSGRVPADLANRPCSQT